MFFGSLNTNNGLESENHQNLCIVIMCQSYLVKQLTYTQNMSVLTIYDINLHFFVILDEIPKFSKTTKTVANY